MAEKIILVDTSILIDYYRKTDKENSVWIQLVRLGYDFVISSVTKYEIYSGATQTQLDFWNEILKLIEVISFDEFTADTAVKIAFELKRKRKQIDIADLFIAATAVSMHLPLATLNRKHFERIDELKMIY